MEAKTFKHIFKEKLGNSSSVNGFGARCKDYPFIRPWSTTTRIESKLEEGGRSMMRSTESWQKGRKVEEGMGWRGGKVG